MAFNLDFSKKSQGGEIKDGSYEVIVNRANEDATPGGSEYIELDLVVRNDVDQPYQNKHIFAKVWKAKATGQYNEGRIMAIADALQLQDGAEYNSLQDLLDDFAMKVANVTIKSEPSQDGKYTNIDVKRWDRTNTRGVVNHQFAKKDFGPDNNRSQQQPKDNFPF